MNTTKTYVEIFEDGTEYEITIEYDENGKPVSKTIA